MTDGLGKRGAAFNRTWGEVVDLNSKLLKLLYGSVSINILLGLVIYSKDTEFILLPPQLDKKIEVSSNKAGQGYKESWAVFVAQLVGNVTPANASFMLKTLGNLFVASEYQRYQKALEDQVEMIRMKRATISFNPESIHYNPVEDKVLVFGREEISLPSGESSSNVRTFEMKIIIEQGYPKVVYFNTYKGQPKKDGE